MSLYLVLELLPSSAAAGLVLLCHFTKSLSCCNLQQLHVWFFYAILPSPWAAAIFSSCMFGSSMSLYQVLELLQSSAAACLVLLCHFTKSLSCCNLQQLHVWSFYAILPSLWAAAIFSSCMFGSSKPLYQVLELLQSSAAACLVLLCHFTMSLSCCNFSSGMFGSSMQIYLVLDLLQFSVAACLVLLCHFTKSLSCCNLQQLHIWFFNVTIPSPWAAAIFSSCMFGSSMPLYQVLELL